MRKDVEWAWQSICNTSWKFILWTQKWRLLEITVLLKKNPVYFVHISQQNTRTENIAGNTFSDRIQYIAHVAQWGKIALSGIYANKGKHERWV